MKNLTPFGKAIRKCRVDRGETQLEVAQALGVSVAFLSAIETGKKNIPSTLLDKIVKHFGVTEDAEASLRKLAWVSQKEIKIDMRGLNDRSREVVAGFARKFSGLDSEQQEMLRKILESGSE